MYLIVWWWLLVVGFAIPNLLSVHACLYPFVHGHSLTL